MHPRRKTGLPGNFRAGARLGSYLLARVVSSVFAVLFAATSFGASNVIQYTYDPAGNITNITRQSTGGLAITSFSPTSGPVGTAVTIYGSGFSATPASNTVTFNGTAATVTASDSGSIATTVPTGATTGRIQVTVNSATVTSSTDFVVTIAGAPTISSFSPTTGASGTVVSVTGANFVATTGATTFALNGVAASGDASTTTAASFTVPASAASGRVTATTSVGTGTSSTDFVVPPPGLAVTDIDSVIRLAAGAGNSTITVGTANKSSLVLFDGTANGWYSLQFKSLNLSPTNATVTYKVLKPDNTQLATGSLSMGTLASIHLPKLTTTGTYTLQLSPGVATLNTLVRLEADPALTVDGAAASFATDWSGQTDRMVFDATAGQRLGAGLQGLTLSGSTSMALYFYKPDGTSLDQVTCLTASSANPLANCSIALQAPVAGTYSILTAQGGPASGSTQISSPTTGTLVADTSQTVSLTRVGQTAVYTFSVASGDNIGIDLSGTSLTPVNSSTTVWLYKPDGSSLTSCSATPPSLLYCELGSPVVTGTYTVVAATSYGVTGSFHLTLKSGPSLATSDPPWSFAPAGAAEVARAKFTATAGQNMFIGLGGLTYTGGSGATYLEIHRADGSTAVSSSCMTVWSGGDCKAELTNAAAGTYSVVVKPPPGTRISGTLASSADLTGTLTVGTPQPITVSRVAQRAVYTFSGTTGDSVAVELYGVTTTPAGENIKFTVYKPDGTTLQSVTLSASPAAGFANLQSLPATGTYKVVVYSDQGTPWSGQLVVTAGSATTIDGSAVTLSESSASQPLRYTFSGTAGQRLDFGVFGLTYATSSSSTTAFTIYKPDGSTLASGTCATSSAGSCDYSSASLPATGTYTVMFAPPATSTITAGSFALSTPLAGTFVIGDPAQSVSISRAGQTARYTFSGTASQTLHLNWSSVSVAGTGSVAVSVLKPDGTTLSSSSFVNGANGGMAISALPTSGAYTVVFDPPSGTTMSGSFALVTP